jgi:hypothetical protein
MRSCLGTFIAVNISISLAAIINVLTMTPPLSVCHLPFPFTTSIFLKIPTNTYIFDFVSNKAMPLPSFLDDELGEKWCLIIRKIQQNLDCLTVTFNTDSSTVT